jgi:predicted PurR-regulated permease PerM
MPFASVTPPAEPLPEDLAVAPPEPSRVLLFMPVDVRSVSLAVMAFLSSLFALRWAEAVVIPVLLGLTFSYALSPLVDRLERLRLPRALGATLLICSLVSGIGWTVWSLSDDAAALVESLPNAAQKVRQALSEQRGPSETAIHKVQRAAAEIEKAAQEGGTSDPVAVRGVTRVHIERAQFDIKDYLWSGTMGLVASAGEALVVVFITFFLLASGNSFRRKMVRIAGPTFARKRITVQALDEITAQVQRYLLVQAFTSLLVGVATWMAFGLVGLEHAAVWGVVACLANLVPYIGSLVVTSGAALVGFVQFGSLHMALIVAAVSMLLHILSGNLLMPWLTSRANRMNAVTIFVGVLAFGWLWGVWGLLLGVPILTTVKAVCDRVDDLKSVGELLGA